MELRVPAAKPGPRELTATKLQVIPHGPKIGAPARALRIAEITWVRTGRSCILTIAMPSSTPSVFQ
jgi:hypothetical protein